jgi:hypothetical protein
MLKCLMKDLRRGDEGREKGKIEGGQGDIYTRGELAEKAESPRIFEFSEAIV